MTPLALVWFGGLLLDAAFGGRKALGALPSLETLFGAVLSFLKQRLAREGRTKRAHFWRGMLVLILLLVAAIALGFALDALLFSAPPLTALAVVLCAQFVRLKPEWQHLSEPGGLTDGKACRAAVSQAIDHASAHLMPGLLAFLLGGFTLLVPVMLLQCAVRHDPDPQDRSFFLLPFESLFRWPRAAGCLLAALALAAATLVWPGANWKAAWKALVTGARSPRDWPLNVAAHAFGWSVEASPARKPVVWIGPAGGTARLKAADVREGLIVTLIATGLVHGFLLLLILTAYLG